MLFKTDLTCALKMFLFKTVMSCIQNRSVVILNQLTFLNHRNYLSLDIQMNDQLTTSDVSFSLKHAAATKVISICDVNPLNEGDTREARG